MIKVKICGITNIQDALAAASLGAWALGFIFYKKSPRYVSPFKVKKIIERLPPFVVPVGVFVNQNEGAVKDIADFCGIRTIQLHGDETPQTCRRLKNFKVIKAFRVGEGFDFKKIVDYPVSAFLFDSAGNGFKPFPTYGGTGEKFNWDILKGGKMARPVILSGGLNSTNIQEAAQIVRPYAVDVSSGVEELPGKKSEKLLREFFWNLRGAIPDC